jgi:alpha-D-xyloside xylohydrolase
MTQTYDSQSYTPRYAPENSIHQDDARIFHRAGFSYASVTGVRSRTVDAQGVSLQVTLQHQPDAWLRIQVLADGLLRLVFAPAQCPVPTTSVMLVEDLATLPSATWDLADDTTRTVISFATERGAGTRRLEIGHQPFSLRICDGTRTVFELETEQVAGEFITPALGLRRSRDPNAAAEPYLSWRIHNDEEFFGLGEKWNKVEKSSTRATIWNTDTAGTNTCDLAYKAVPVLHSTAGWGLMVHCGHRTRWEVGSFAYTSGSVHSEAPSLDAFIFLADDLKGLVRAYASLTGRPIRPPRWALGLWMSRCAYYCREQVDGIVDRLRAERIPCDVVHLDPMWMQTHYYHRIGVDACDFDWNHQSWPDHVGMMRRWKEEGFATCFWLNPYLPEGHPIYTEAHDAGYLLRSTKGGIARLAYGEPVGTVDFTNPAAREWWKHKLKQLVADGAWVFKPDYGDRVPDDALFHDGRTGVEMHNLFLHHYVEAAWQAVHETRGEAIVWRRPGYIGTQRYAGTWAGDTQVTWEAMRTCLRGGLSAGFTAECFWSHDMGGFVGGKPDTELYIRWAQWGFLSPFCRFHGTSPREPWEFGDDALRIVRECANLRYTLIPYLERLTTEACATGIPLLRHLKLEYQDDPTATHVDDQYLLGPDLLVAPVFHAGATTRRVYLPAGRWIRWDDTSERHHGPAWVTVAAPLDRIPLFVRARAGIETYATVPQHLKGDVPDVVIRPF